MRKIYTITIVIIVQTLSYSQDSLKKTFISFQFGGLRQINIDANEKQYYSYNAGINIGFKTKKDLIIQTGLEYYRTNFYTKAIISGSNGGADSANYFQFDKFCIPLYFNYISKKNNIIIGGGPVIDLINNYKHSFVKLNYDPNGVILARNASIEKINDYSPLYLSIAAKTDYIVNLGQLKLIFGIKFKYAIYNKTFYTYGRGGSAIQYRDVNCSVNLGLMF